jgi:hypothetical protein
VFIYEARSASPPCNIEQPIEAALQAKVVLEPGGPWLLGIWVVGSAVSNVGQTGVHLPQTANGKSKPVDDLASFGFRRECS